MLKAAKAFSMRDMESTMRETDGSKDRRRFKMDMAKLERNISARETSAVKIDARKAANDIKKAILEGKIADPDYVTLDALGNPQVDFTIEETTVWQEGDDVY